MVKNIEGLIAHVCAEIKKHTDVAVLGLSGGADSTLVAILCKRALGAENVFGVHMPRCGTDTEGEKFNARSVKLAKKLGVKDMYAPVSKITDEISIAVGHAVQEHFPHEDGVNEYSHIVNLSVLNCGNASSRARMTVLYGISHHLNECLKKRVRVVGTGNMSEDFIGYDTKGGDALCDFFPIGELFKSEVYQMLDYFKEQGEIDEEHIDRVPSAGLWDGQTDEGELGYTYNEMEPVIKLALAWRPFIENTPLKTDLHKFVIDRHFANKHKHEAPPVIALRREFCDD